MRADLRWKVVLLAGGLTMSAAPALAQAVPDTTTNTPASDAIGPRELQNFSLPGTKTKPAEQPATPPPASSNPPPRENVRAEPRAQAPDATPVVRDAARQPVREAAPAATPTRQVTQEPLPPPTTAIATVEPQPSLAAAAPGPADPSPGTLAPERRLPFLPWLMAALALAAGTIFILWRRSHRKVLAAGPEFDLFVAPEPVPQPRAPTPAPRAAAPQPVPRPQPTPPQPAPPRPSGIVATRLRPSLELDMRPLRCTIEDEQVTIEFEVELFNAGTAPARAVIAEASLFNASATQEQDLAAFYARPVSVGDRLDGIAPMKRMTFVSQVVAPRAGIQEYELAGRKSFVPVIAFNAQYEWSGGKGQSSLAFLLGRETRSDKLAPLHLDGAHRELRGLGARVLPTAVRT